MYSKEDGTPAYNLKDSVSTLTKKHRYNKIMETQSLISSEKLQQKIGNEYTILLEDYTDDGKYLIGRTYMDIPEEDGVVLVENSNEQELIVGNFYQCVIDEVAVIEQEGKRIMSNYDLLGHIL